MINMNLYKFKKGKIKSGFVLKKDYYMNNLYKEHKKFPSINKYNFVNILNNSNIQRQILNLSKSIRVRKIIPSFNNNNINKSHKDLKKLQFPLPKVYFPSMSQVDFYSNIKGKYNIRNLDDDLNVTSNRTKKIFYHYKYDNDSKSHNSESKIFLQPKNSKKNLKLKLNKQKYI